MEHKNIYEQPNKNRKKAATVFTSLAVAGALLIAGTKVCSNFKLKKNTEVTTEVTTTMVSNEESNLLLTEGFDINNPDEVSKRAQDIYDISEKKRTVLDIQNSKYIVNGLSDNIIYPDNIKTDDQKLEYVQSLVTLLSITLDDYLSDYTAMLNYIVNDGMLDLEFAGNTNYIPYAYMWMPQTNEAKKLAIEIAKVCEEQRSNIENKDVSAMHETADKFYDLFLQIEKTEASYGEQVLLYNEFDAKLQLFVYVLDKEKLSDLKQVPSYITQQAGQVYSEIGAREGWKLSPTYEKALEEGTFGKDISKEIESYRAEEASQAEEYYKELNDQIKNESSVVNEGGAPAGDSSDEQEVIDDTVTTRVSESEFVVSIPDEGTVVVTEPGGAVVDESMVAEPSTTAPSETTTYVDANEDIPVISDKEFFGQATEEDIEDYRNAPYEKAAYTTGVGILAAGVLGRLQIVSEDKVKKKRKNK